MKRVFYHISQQFLGHTWTAVRRVPNHPAVGERPTPRLCACPTLPGCLSARYFDTQPVFVYRTARPYGSNRPVGVWDACITGERWLVPPVEMEFVRSFDAEWVADLMLPTKLWLKLIRKIEWRVRIAQYGAACQALSLRVPDWVMHYTSSDPYNWIIEHAYQRSSSAASCSASST